MMRKILLNFQKYWRLLPTLLMLMFYSFNGLGQTILNESFDSGIPATWTINNANSDGFSFVSPASYGIGGTKAYAAGMGCSDDYLISPQISITSANFALSYDAAVESATYKYSFKVMVSTTDTDPTSFTEIADVSDYDQIAWTNNSISLSAYNGQTIYIAFYAYAAGSTSWSFGFDNIKVEALLSNELNAADITTSPSMILNGDEVTLIASVSNDGANPQSDVIVDFKVDGLSIGNQTITSIASGATETAQINWTSTEGGHTVSFELPSDDFNDNNIFSKNINVLGENSLVEDFEGTWPPQAWTVDPVSSSWQQYSFNQYEGSKCAYVSASAGKRLITPKLVIDATSSIAFYGKMGFGTNSIKFQYSTDKTTWTDVPSGSVSLNGTYAQYTVDLSGLTPGNYYIAFDYELSYSSVYIDLVVGPDVVVEAPQEAINPLPADAAIDQSILPTLTWNANGSGGIPTAYKVYVGTDGAGTVTPTNLVNGTLQTETSFTPSTPLEYSTTYYWQIIPTNSLGDASNCPIWSFNTIADPTQTIPYSQDFEEGTTPTGWNLSNFSVQNYGKDASKSLTVDMSYLSTASAVTCPIGPALTSTQIVFDYRICVPEYFGYPQQGYSLTASDKIDVKVSTDGGSNYTTVYTIDQTTHTRSTEFAAEYITLDATYDTKNIVVKIEATKGGTALQLDIDNFLVRETPTTPIFSLDKTAIDFGYQAVGVEPSSVVKVTNTGGGSLSISDGDITITGTDADQFSFDDPSFPVSLAAGESKNITVKLVSTSGGNKSASLNIAHNAAGSPEIVSLAGEAYMPLESFTEGFESTSIDEVPKGWIANFDGYAWCGTSTTASAAHGGTNSMTLAKYGADLVTFVTPAVANFSTNRLKFWAKSSATSTSFSVGTITDPSDPDTYTEFESVPLTTTYAEYIVDFSTYSGTDMFLAIKTPSSEANTTQNLDNVVWEAIPTTPLLGVESSNIEFDVIAANNTENLNLVVSNAGIGTLTLDLSDFVITGTDASDFVLGTNTFPLNLAENETANVELIFQPSVAGNKTATLTISHNGSNPSGVVTLSGEVLPEGSLIEDFNATSFPSTGWTAETGWGRQTYSAYEGEGHAFISPSSEATDVKLITPLLEIKNGDAISFYTKTTATPAPTIKVMYSDDVSGTWTQIGTTITVESNYALNQIDLTSIAGNNYYIAFAVSSGSYKSTYLDMVTGPVIVTNGVPEFTSTEVTEGKVGETYTYNIIATDSDGDNLVITAPTKPSWLDITDNGDGTAILTGTPTVDGDYNVSLLVDDGKESVNQDFTITVAPETKYAVNFSVVGSNGTLAATVDAVAISSGDDVVEGEDVVFTATPATGYRVKEWTLNSVAVSSNTTNTYTLSGVSAISTVTVEFEEIPATTYAVNFSVVGSNGTLAATVDAVSISSGDEVVEGEDVVFTATPATGYRVKEWTLNSVAVSGNTSNTYTLSGVSAISTVTVEFEEIPATTYAVSFSVVGSNGTLAATVDAVSISSGDDVVEGEDVFFTATPATGYRVKEWTLNSVAVSGNTTDSYTLSGVSAISTVTVEFEEIPATTYAVNFSVVGSNGTLAATVDAVSISSGDEVVEGEDVVFTATPATGYRVKEWTLNSVAVSGNTTNTYTLSGVSAISTVTVEFEEIPATTYAVNFSVVGSNGTLAATVDAVAISSGDEVVEGEDVVFTATPATGYRVKEWTLNSVAVSGNTTNTYTLSGVSAISTVTVEFEEIPATTYAVNFSVVGSNGTLAATVDAVAISSGDDVVESKDVVFTATPDANYEILEWKLNDVVISDNTTNTYTLTNLADVATISVEFKLTTGIEPTIETNLNVFPIPSEGEFTVDLGYNIQNKGSWTLSNLNGQVVTHGVINQPRFEVRNYSRGVYILTINVDQQTVTRRIIIE